MIESFHSLSLSLAIFQYECGSIGDHPAKFAQYVDTPPSTCPDRFSFLPARLDSNNLMNPSITNLTSAECRQSDEVSNQMMNCLRYVPHESVLRHASTLGHCSCSFQPARCTSDFVRKQLQSTIQGRQKSAGGKDIPPGVTDQKSKLMTHETLPRPICSLFQSDEFNES